MNRSEEAAIRGGRRNRMIGVTVLALGWGLLVALILTWAFGAGNANAASRHDTAKNSIRNVRAKILTGSQQQAAASSSIQVQLARVKGRMPSRISMTVTVARIASSSPARGGSTTVRSGNARSRVVRIKLNPGARKILGDCATPLVKVKVTVNGRSKTAVRKLKSKRSLCAVPKDVDLSKAPKCEWIDDPANPCLGTYPNNYFTRTDTHSETGRRLNLAPDATPATKPVPGYPQGVNIGVETINQSDGFSPGPLLQVKIPGLDTQVAFDSTGLVSEADMGQAYRSDQPAVLIDAKTGERQLIWTELDSNASTSRDRVLIIRPGKNLTNGHRYIVALRNLKNGGGDGIKAPAGFRLYRDRNLTSNKTVERRRSHFESIFKSLGRAGVKRSSLYLAWDFTVASTDNLTGRMTSIRNRAFEDLGDTNLTDGTVQGSAPQFTITQVDDYSSQPPPFSGDGVEDIRKIQGTFRVPCYLANKANPGDPDCAPGSTFKLDDNQKPIRTPNSFYTARFKCNIPRSAVWNDGGTWKVDHKVRPSLYGHGLFGDIGEVSSKNIRQLGTENGVMVCGTDWIGMADEDVITAMGALMDLTRFPALPDRLQQGFLNFLFLGRLMIHPNGLAADPNFKFDGQSVIDTSDLFYYGNSQGGIAGGALTSVATDFTRSVLYVGAMNYSTLLNRSVDFDMYKAIMDPYYPKQLERQLIFSLMQTMWDRGEPNGYANHMTTDPLPKTPAHKVLMLMAYGDHQVANVATEVEARTIGAPLRRPAVSRDRLNSEMIRPWFQHDVLGSLPGPDSAGSGFFAWDIGPKRVEGGQLYGTDAPPLANIPPTTSENESGDGSDGYGIDPHDTVIRSSPLARKQIADFIKTNGKITNPCGSNPCWAAGWQDMP
ncbi:MAG: hypothetical protein M9938_04175 [Solirubrobacterales bacterium]|nr:hypothetical protein [Solirubrobacterales bacterium]